MTILVVEGLSKSWGGNKAIDGMTFSLEKDAMALIGPNGAGKTTLLSSIAGITLPDQGRIIFDGIDITKTKIWKRVGLGLVKTFQVVRPFVSLTVRENLELFSRVHGGSDIDSVLEVMGLSQFGNKKARELSHGNLKRLEVAKALMTNPKLLLLDEPIGGLSNNEAVGVIDALSSLKKKGTKMIIVEHRLSEIFPFVDSVVVMDKGKKIFQGTTTELFDDEKVREAYMGGETNADS